MGEALAAHRYQSSTAASKPSSAGAALQHKFRVHFSPDRLVFSLAADWIGRLPELNGQLLGLNV